MTEVIAVDKLKSYVSRIEKLEQEKSDISELIKEVFDEAKSEGFDTKIMKQVIKLRKLDDDTLSEQDAILELYRSAFNL